MHLTRETVDNRLVYIWVDPYGRQWHIYRALGAWRYRRTDHTISSVGYPTLEAAKTALRSAFENI